MARRPRSRAAIVTERIRDAMVIARGQRVLLDADLAALYQVDIKSLNQVVKRNVARFPVDFMFQLDARQGNSSRRRWCRDDGSAVCRSSKRLSPHAHGHCPARRTDSVR
jgi:ORF6N domain-containing protein